MTSRRSFAALLCVAAAISCGDEPSADGAAGGEDRGAPGAGTEPADTGGPPQPAADTAAAGPMIHPRRDPSAPAAPDTTPEASDTGRAAGADTSADRPAPSPLDTATWSTGTVSVAPTVGYTPMPVLTAVRTGTHAGYERMTLELGDASGLPSYHVEYVDRPLIECGSGDQLFPVGDAWLELRLEPAAAHTEAGQPTIGAREIVVGGPLLLRVYRTCDFEGVVSLVMALADPNPYRVLTLSDPWRIVVDVRR